MVHVLVVDDDPLFREITCEILDQAGFEVSLAEDGAIAAQLELSPAPQVAVVDMLMPERDGIETIRALRDKWPGLKVIAVSAGARGIDANLLLRAAKVMGADATLEKPLQAEPFLALVRAHVGQS